MSSVNRVKLPGLATGMDTDAMVKQMVTDDQNKIDKAKQKEQIINWQQETYRDVISDIKGFNDKYFSVTSNDSIISSSAWNTLTTASSNSNVITATATADAENIDYNFDVVKPMLKEIIDIKKEECSGNYKELLSKRLNELTFDSVDNLFNLLKKCAYIFINALFIILL